MTTYNYVTARSPKMFYRAAGKDTPTIHCAISKAILEERTRMARDIHDTLAQAFTGVIVQLDTAIEALRDEEPEAAAKHIRRARELARESLTEARHSVLALRPRALEKAGFADALKAIIKNTTAGTSLRSVFELNGEPRKLQSSVEE